MNAVNVAKTNNKNWNYVNLATGEITTKLFDPFFPRIWNLAHNRSLELGPVSRLMGILNVTPDSFSDGGRYSQLASAIDHAARMIDEGADIIDVGGESTRPGAEKITFQEEQSRVIPVIEALAGRFDVAISIDTYRDTTAKLALDAGAHIINDVSGLLHNDNIAKLVAGFKAGVCIMHNSRNRDVGKDLIADQFDHLDRSLKIAFEFGISNDQIVLDPGFGFGKNAAENIELLSKFERLNAISFPWVCGTSRKRFIGSILGPRDSELNRDIGTTATSIVARMKGASIFRVHNVGTNSAGLKIADAIISSA